MGSGLSTPNIVMGGATIAVGAISAALYQYFKPGARFAVSPDHPYSTLFRELWKQGRLRLESIQGHDFLDLGDSTPDIDRIMIRDAYAPALTFIKNHAEAAPLGGVIVSGHPGIGKTLFLYYIPYQRLLDRKPTLLQTDNNVFYLFSDSGVQELPSSLSYLGGIVHPGTWALVDSNVNVTMPAEAILDCRKVFIISAASPRPDRMKWRKARNQHRICTYYMELWTPEELVAALPYQGLGDEEAPTEAQLRTFYDLYGPSARDAYSFARQPDEYEEMLRIAINNLTGDAIRKAMWSRNLDSVGMKESHKVFLVQPSPQDDALQSARSSGGETSHIPDRHRKSFVSVVSTNVMDLLWKAHDGEIRDDLIKHFRMTLQDPATKALAGQIFERAVHPVLSKGGKFQVYEMTAKQHSSNMHWKTSAETQELQLQLQQRRLKLFANINELQPNSEEYYQPIASDNRTFDSFIYDSGSDRVVTLF
ncbi:hypothetical protein FRB99_003624, partial [Tulasnella sp. 403]